MKHKLIGLAALGVGITVVLVAQPSSERSKAEMGTVIQGDGAKDKEKKRVLRPRFTVTSSKEAYVPTQRIMLTLTLSLKKRFWSRDTEEVEHGAPAKVTVETFEAGTISMVSATRDGKPIEPTQGLARYDDDPVGIQIDSLKTIGPGDHVAIPFDIPHLSSQGSRLVVVELNPESENLALIYSLQEPGWYTLQFRYRYTGPEDGKPNVFRGELLSNPVSFLVREVKAGQRGTEDPGIACDEPTDPDDPAFVAQCHAAMEHSRTATPNGEARIESLEQSNNTHIISRRTEVGNLTVPENRADATNGHGTSTIIQWNPDDHTPLSDGTPRDPYAELTHEIDHAYHADRGEWVTEKVPGTNVDEDEIHAAMEENDQRLHDGLPLRKKIGDAKIPTASPSPSHSP
jgi:hypothetical protein